MSTRKNIITACFAALLALGLVACGGSSSRPMAEPQDDLAVAREAAMTAAEAAKTAWQAVQAAFAGLAGMQAYNPTAYAQTQNALSDAMTAYEAAKAAAEAAAAAAAPAEARRQQEIAETAKAAAEAANASAMALVQEVKDVPVARMAAAAAAEAARMAYHEAMAALAAVEANKADDMVSYDTAAAKVADAKAAYEAAKAAAAMADASTTSAAAKAAQAAAEAERDKARTAQADAARYAAMVADRHGTVEQLRVALSAAKAAAARAAAEAMAARDAARAAVDALEDKKDDDIPSYTRAMEQLAMARSAYTAAKAASDAAAAAMATSSGVAEAERQQGIAEAEQAKAEAANAQAMRFAALVVASYNAAEAARTRGGSLVRSTVPPLFHDEDIDDDDRGPLFTVPTLASTIRRDHDERRSGFANDTYIKSLGFANVAADDGIPFSLHVTYVIGGEEVTVHFTDADRDSPDYDFSWTKTVDGVEYWGWLYKGDGAQDDAISFLGGIPGHRLYGAGGIRTATADLPSGTAVYVGGMRGDTHLTNDPSSSGRESMSGSLRLTANFDAASLEGRISDIRIRPEPPKPRVWSSLPDTTWFRIDNGRIVDGQFTADLTGMDSNANAPANETVSGYEGGVLGEFYGPSAKEVGGVLNASRDDRVMAGAFGGTTGGDRTPTGSEGLVRSTVTPVHWTGADSWASAGLETHYPVSSSNALRDWNDSTVTLGSGDFGLHEMSVAGTHEAASGGVEVIVTYELDGDVHTISFTTDDYLEDGGYWEKEIDGESLSFWYGGEFENFSTVGFHPCEAGVCLFSYGTIGARTEAARMPTGTATYLGSARADTWLEDEPGSSPNRQRIWGVLRLSADFAESSLDGRITDIQVRRQTESDRSDWPDTTYLAIHDGRIVDGQFTADLTGMDTNANAPIGESLRGYEGGVLGEFYGSSAEEVGGVFNASRDDRLMVGWLGGAQFDPDRLARTSRTAVSVGVDRNFSASTSQLTDAAGVTAVRSDGAGGFYVTYMVDGARQRIHLPVSGYDPGDRGYNTEGPPDYGIWDAADSYDRSPEFDYVSVNGWYIWDYDVAPDGTRTNHDTQRGHMVYGQPTAVLPAGTAEYAGRMYLNRWSRTDPTNATGRRQLQSSLALTADFDNRTVGGRLHGWSQRAYASGSYEAIDAEVAIRNGTIANAEFTADLAGTGGNFTGNMTGRFFGPGAAEVGGVIDGETTDNVFEGWFAGKKQ